MKIMSLLWNFLCSLFFIFLSIVPNTLLSTIVPSTLSLRSCHNVRNHVSNQDETARTGRRKRADKIGVGAGGDIGGTECIFMATQYTGPTWQSYRNDHRHVCVMPATHSINMPAWCAEQVRTSLPCDVRCFVASLEKIGACSFVGLFNRSL